MLDARQEGEERGVEINQKTMLVNKSRRQKYS
jgi:hypothetical protein